MEQNWNARGIEAMKKGDNHQAIEILKEGHLAKPEDDYITYHLGIAYAKLVRTDEDYVDEAIATLMESARHDHIRSWYALGTMFDPMFGGKFAKKIKNSKKAIECYRKALTLADWKGQIAAESILRMGTDMLHDNFRRNVEGAAYFSLLLNYPERDQQACDKLLKLCKTKLPENDFKRLYRIKDSISMFAAIHKYYLDRGERELMQYHHAEALYMFESAERIAAEANMEGAKETLAQWQGAAMYKVAEYYAQKGKYFEAAAFARGAWKTDGELQSAKENSQNYCLGMKQEDLDIINTIESFEDAKKVVCAKEEKAREDFWSLSIDQMFSKVKAVETVEITKEEEPTSDSLKELDELIGMDSLKKDVREMISLLKIQRMREKAGMKTMSTSKHLVFTGNPGTGKTTVARIIGKVYKELGILSGGQIVEVAREDLVAGYVGQTALKTQQVIEEAMGGILFIDEAYTLAKGDGRDFGQEAIDAILKVMEDCRDDFVVIVAGYPEQMQDFIDSNPGLKSRFNKYLHFPDYSAEEMEEIFYKMAESSDFILDDGAKAAIKQSLADLEASKDANFANAREVRNLLEKISMKQAMRLATNTSVTVDELKTIRLTDVLESVK